MCLVEEQNVGFADLLPNRLRVARHREATMGNRAYLTGLRPPNFFVPLVGHVRRADNRCIRAMKLALRPQPIEKAVQEMCADAGFSGSGRVGDKDTAPRI